MGAELALHRPNFHRKHEAGKKIIERYLDRILPMDLEVSLRWGEITGLLEANGISLPIADGLIAAAASVHGLALVTRNEEDFRRAGVEVYNPWK